ncbi:MAG: electron transport complex subunit E [Oscillospiraceae bacterium]|nr:electron transport complex subunit E [Oscillospiraceae bacterium]
MATKQETTVLEKKNSPDYFYEFFKGIVKENPTLVGLLGMCPTLAVTATVKGSLGMGLSTMFVLICSNLLISLIKNLIPKSVRLPAYIVIIAGFVTIVKLILARFLPPVSELLGVYLDLITVNCIILGRAEMFASKNKPLASVLDGAGMGLGFTLALFLMGSLREIIGAGSWFGLDIPFITNPVTLIARPAGGFFTLGIIIALVGVITNKKPKMEAGCANCPSKDNCPTAEKGEDK